MSEWADFPPGSVAVTVTVVSPTATAIRVTTASATSAVRIDVSADTALYVSGSLLASVK